MRRERFDAFLRDHPLVIDGIGVLGATALLQVLFGLQPNSSAGLLGLAQVLPLVVRRLLPLPVFAVVSAAAFGQWVLGVELMPANAGLLVALYTVAAYGTRTQSRVALAVGLAGVVLAIQRYWLPYERLSTDLAVVVGLFAGVVLAAWTSGDLRRTRLLHVAALRDRAAQLERDRDREMRLATVAERARIAREMHDVVAHGLSVIIVQADGARYASERDPSAATGALETISATGRQALTEMRRMLGLLRATEDGSDPTDAAVAGGSAGADREPQPGLGEVEELVERVRAAGLPVELTTQGDPRPLAPSLELTAYRTIQEGLTNVLKHGGPGSRAWVRLTYRPDELEVRVADDGRGAAAAGERSAGERSAGERSAGERSAGDGQGLGLAGMRERVAVSGGRMHAGPRTGGGFEVVVGLPSAVEAVR